MYKLYLILNLSKKDTWCHAGPAERRWALKLGVRVIHVLLFAFFFSPFSFSSLCFFPFFLSTFLPPVFLFFIPPNLFFLSLLPSFFVSPKSATSFSKPSLSGRPLSSKHFQHCHYKLVEMIRLPGRLVLSPLQRGRCSAKPASAPQRSLANPQGSHGDPMASASWVQTMCIIKGKRGSVFLRITGLCEDRRSLVSSQEKKMFLPWEPWIVLSINSGVGMDDGSRQGRTEVLRTEKREAHAIPLQECSKVSSSQLKCWKGERERGSPSHGT